LRFSLRCDPEDREDGIWGILGSIVVGFCISALIHFFGYFLLLQVESNQRNYDLQG